MVTYLLEGLSPCVYQSYLWETPNISRQNSSKNSQYIIMNTKRSSSSHSWLSYSSPSPLILQKYTIFHNVIKESSTFYKHIACDL